MSKQKDKKIKSILSATGLKTEEIKGMLIVATDGDNTMYSIYGEGVDIAEALIVASHKNTTGEIDQVVQAYNGFTQYLKSKSEENPALFPKTIIGEA